MILQPVQAGNGLQCRRIDQRPCALEILRPAAIRVGHLRAAIVAYADAIHPYRDGHSSERVIAATEDFIDSGRHAALAHKPLSALWRRWQIRRELGYAGF